MTATVNLSNLSYLNSKDTVKQNLTELEDNIVNYLVKNCSLLINDIEMNGKSIKLINDEIVRYIKDNKIEVPSSNTLEELQTSINSDIWGYGRVQKFINDDSVSDIYIFSRDCIFIKRNGILEPTDVRFPTDMSLLNFCYGLAIKNEGSLSEVNASQILSDAKTQKNAILRMDLVIAPIACGGSQVEIRRLPKKKKTFKDLIKDGMLDEDIVRYLIMAVKSGLNIVWTGRGGSGKTTLMNTCLDYVPEDEVQLIMQESQELFTSHKATYTQKVKKKLGENDKAYTLKDLTINALLMSLDRMVIGEIKDQEAMEFFNAVYTGHIGWTSVHSPSSEECLNKIVHLMKYSNTDLPREDLMEMLTQIDLIIYMEDYKCFEITEVSGWDDIKKKPKFNPVFKLQLEKTANGYKHKFVKVCESCKKVLRKVDKAVASGKFKGDDAIV